MTTKKAESKVEGEKAVKVETLVAEKFEAAKTELEAMTDEQLAEIENPEGLKEGATREEKIAEVARIVAENFQKELLPEKEPAEEKPKEPAPDPMTAEEIKAHEAKLKGEIRKLIDHGEFEKAREMAGLFVSPQRKSAVLGAIKAAEEEAARKKEVPEEEVTTPKDLRKNLEREGPAPVKKPAYKGRRKPLTLESVEHDLRKLHADVSTLCKIRQKEGRPIKPLVMVKKRLDVIVLHYNRFTARMR